MTTVGILGVGVIGTRFLEDLLETGYDPWVYDIADEQVAAATDRGARAASDPADLTTRVDVLLLALPGSPEVEATMTGERGILSALETGQVVVDASTTLPETAVACAEYCADRGAHFVDAPLTGAAPKPGTQMMVGAREGAYETARAVIETVSNDHVLVGDPGDATVLKLALQLRYAGQRALDAELVTFLEAADVDARLLRDFFEMDVQEEYYERDFSQRLEGLGTLAIWHKDVGYAIAVARETGATLPLSSVVYDAYEETVRTVDEGEGSAEAIITYWE
ncbi:NAD(P)-dependent oxidoreductase [Natronobiforma cellulositropha]|uniref:NAD(P)-dependent oxidoreductase n=1 Tax=Natronobiforma cellulositropha TaxID=1679076 RepID=UPI0021D58261|nr:NAD(P)-dependent oxidoreductase [Natronobiforma cellulositropha]